MNAVSDAVPHSGAVSSIRPESPIDSIIRWMRSRLCQLKPSAVVENVLSNPLCLRLRGLCILDLERMRYDRSRCFPKKLDTDLSATLQGLSLFAYVCVSAGVSWHISMERDSEEAQVQLPREVEKKRQERHLELHAGSILSPLGVETSFGKTQN